MLHYAVVFFVIALIAALFGFTGIAAGAANIAQVLFVVFIVLAEPSGRAHQAKSGMASNECLNSLANCLDRS